MKSGRAKVLHELGGLPLITYVCRTARSLVPGKICVVVGHQAAEVERAVRTEVGDTAEFVTQTEQRGAAVGPPAQPLLTGVGVEQAMP